jgi:genome maintenance exonuclease 1
MAGVYRGKPSIVDFKQSNKFKTDDRVVDYKLQLAAYALAHDVLYGTDIKQGVILMCTKDLVVQNWVLNGSEFEEYKNLWWKRVADYYEV